MQQCADGVSFSALVWIFNYRQFKYSEVHRCELKINRCAAQAYAHEVVCTKMQSQQALR